MPLSSRSLALLNSRTISSLGPQASITEIRLVRLEPAFNPDRTWVSLTGLHLRVSMPRFSWSQPINVQSGAVAQLGARVNGIHEVAGSIPASSTKPTAHAVSFDQLPADTHL